MNLQTKTTYKHEAVSHPIVRIDTLDEHYVDLMREFFAENGCEVFINTSPTSIISYHIIVGDWDFVKKIVDTTHLTYQKSLVILWETHIDDAKEFIKGDRKIALLDISALSQETLSTVLNFFFVDKKNFLELQKKTPTKKIVQSFKRVENNQTVREQLHQEQHREDFTRIARTINAIFEKPKTQLTSKPIKEKKVRKFITLTTLILLLLFVPLLYSIITFFVSVIFLYSGASCIRQLNTSCVSRSTMFASSFLNQSNQTFQIISYPLTLLGKQTTRTSYQTLYKIIEESIHIEQSLSEIGDSANSFAYSFISSITLTKTDSSPIVEVEKIKTKLFPLQNELDMTSLRIESIKKNPPFPLSTPSFFQYINQADFYITKLRNTINIIDKLLLLYPYISGYKEPMTLLVLLQNSAELRPTGGFIGSLMKIEINDGKISTTAIEDVYQVDGQLRGHIDPPNPIRELLSQEHWYLRDSNWDPNFKESAARALWFYEKETGQTPQGVIGVSTPLIVQFLEITGPIQLTDFNDKITASNFYAKAMFYTQENFFPGSTQKKDFLGSLFSSLLNKVIGENRSSGIQLFQLLQDGLVRKNIQFYFVNPEPQQLVNQFNWSGEVPTKPLCAVTTNASPCFSHYVYINEANMGVNKVNDFIKRQDRRDITIVESGRVSEVLTRTIMNASANEPGTGVYRAYVRIFIPKDAHITSFMLDGVPVKTRKIGGSSELPYGELDASTNTSFNILSAALDVPPGVEHTIRITYDRSFNIMDAKSLHMELLEQKQPGIISVPTLMRIRYPAGWTLDNATQQDALSLANNGYLEYNTFLLQDAFIKLQFNTKHE